MCEAAAAHRVGILLADRTPVAGGERGGDRAFPAVQLRTNMPGQSKAERPLARRRGQMHPNWRQRPPGRAYPQEKRPLGKIISAWNGRRSGRHQPGAKGDFSALAHGGGPVLLRHVDPDPDGKTQRRIGREEQAHPLQRRLRLHRHHLPPHLQKKRTRDRLFAPDQRLAPDQHASGSGQQRPCRQHHPQPPARWQAERHQRQNRAGADPHCPTLRIGQRVPGEDADAQRHRHPQGDALPLGFKPAFQPVEDSGKKWHTLRRNIHL